MSHGSKVIPLTGADGGPRNAGINKKIPPILHSVRQSAKRHLSTLLEQLFDNTDDALFEMADRSRSDADQSMYFESMRELRLKRKQIASGFIAAFYRGFEETFIPDATSEAPAELDLETAGDNLTLLKNDELEISVAIAGIVSKVGSRHSIALMQLARRIDHICADRSVTERLNPLGPFRIATAFAEALECLDIDIRIRIIVMKLFERFVMEQLGPCFEEANRLLGEAGVLTDIRAVLRKERDAGDPHHRRAGTPGSSAGSPGGGADAGGYSAGVDGYGFESRGDGGAGGGYRGALGGQGGGDGGHTGFGVLRRLLAEGRQSAGGGSGVSGDVAAGAIISTPQLMSVLSHAQTENGLLPIDLEHVPAPVDLRQFVLTTAANVTGEAHSAMAESDEDVVNLVGMLFDYILNDRNLAIPMKALIGRLQIAVLKVAVIDKSFFGKTSHPARQLLNELASAGIGWSSSVELKRDPLYDKIESVVLRVLNHFDDDLTLFEQLVTELREFVGGYDRKTGIVEQRVRESETGKAKTVAARKTVQRLINQKASGLRLPPHVGHFISDTWSRVLVYVCVKHGVEGEQWQQMIQTMDDLLWSVQPLDDMASVERRDRMIPNLLERMEHAMREISATGTEIEQTTEEIGRLLKDIADNDRAFLEDDTLDPPAADEELPIMEEIVLTAADLADAGPGAAPEIEPEPEIVTQLNRLSEGVWVEFAQEDGTRMRCKVAAVVEPGRYIFVNRRGMKVAEKTRMGLAVEFKRKSAVILDESQVFERALEAVIGNLRQMHRQPAAT